MDALFLIGQLGFMAGLAYGAGICFRHAGLYDEETLRAGNGSAPPGRPEAVSIFPCLDLAVGAHGEPGQ
jgi:hypothetical protein